MSSRLTRREVLGAGLAGAAAVTLAGCGTAAPPRPGSTLRRTVVDPRGSGLLALGPGERFLERTELAGAGAPGRTLLRLGQLTDVHVHDAESPARVPFLDRLGGPFKPTFRPQETLMAHVLGAALPAIDAAHLDAVLVSGDIVDSAQLNELDWSLGILSGRPVRPDSGARGYIGVQGASNPDPFYYRPDVDAPRHPGLLDRALSPVRSPGLRTRWHPVLGNHDVLVQGEFAPTPVTRRIATGDRLLVEADPDRLKRARTELATRGLDAVLRGGLGGHEIRVPPDERRVHLSSPDVIARLRAAASGRSSGPRADRLDYVVPVGDELVLVVLDLVRRDQGAGGLLTTATIDFLREALAHAGERWVVVCSHQPLADSEGAEEAFALLDPDPRVIALVAGHTHRNAVVPRRTPSGGFWQITTCSLIDWPQQWRALRVVETSARAVAIEAWMVDHPGRPRDDEDLAGIARELAYLDAQGGRPAGAAGTRSDRNVRLHLPPRLPKAPRTPPRALPRRHPRPAGTGVGDAV